MANDNQTADKALNQQILQGNILGAFDQYYADAVTMQENSNPVTAGKAANRVREEQFVASIAEFHGATLVSEAFEGDTGFSEWWMDITFQGGTRHAMEQVGVRKWKDGKVVAERFYYNGGK